METSSKRTGPSSSGTWLGADPYEQDQLGGLALTRDGLRRRDEIVFEISRDASIPVAVAFAGGYAARESDTVEIHCETVRAARRRMETERSETR